MTSTPTAPGPREENPEMTSTPTAQDLRTTLALDVHARQMRGAAAATRRAHLDAFLAAIAHRLRGRFPDAREISVEFGTCRGSLCYRVHSDLLSVYDGEHTVWHSGDETQQELLPGGRRRRRHPPEGGAVVRCHRRLAAGRRMAPSTTELLISRRKSRRYTSSS